MIPWFRSENGVKEVSFYQNSARRKGAFDLIYMVRGSSENSVFLAL